MHPDPNAEVADQTSLGAPDPLGGARLRRGLTDKQAQERLRSDGPNELPRQSRRPLWKIAADILREPMFQLLLAAGLVYLALGDRGEAALLLLFCGFSMFITVAQQARTERTLEALRDLSSPRALVIRDGRQLRVAGREVVRGDILVLAEGDRVAADALVLSAQDLAADESLLTGESVPVTKAVAGAPQTAPHPGGDGLSYVFSGSLIVRGRGLAQVQATGARSELGRVGVLLTQVKEEATPLSLQLGKLVRVFATTGMAISASVVLIYGLAKGAWLQGLLAGIALAMSLLPEEFPLVLTVFLALGARRLAQTHVLSRRASSIEALGAATVLCSDKTGTLTLNRMSVAELHLPGAVHPVKADATLPPGCTSLVRCAARARAAEPTDPMERAILELAGAGASVGRMVHAYGLSPDLLAMTQVWRRSGDTCYTVAAKGAPEAIIDLCRLVPAERVELQAAQDDMAQRGLRVIAVAQARFEGAVWPATQREFDFAFLGLVGLADPVRPAVPQAIQDCRAAGIRVMMITGDYPATALAIAGQAGLDVSRAVLSGAEIDMLDDAQLGQRIKHTAVCARVMPKHKLRIVQALKGAGEIVAMTGDGVNDAPSLRAAHIGIAMGGRGTDVAREAAALVLLDDEFGSVVRAIRVGRRIYDNLRKAMAYILAVHVPIAGLTLLPLLFGWPTILGPVHIAFLEFLIDPVCSIVFEAEPEEEGIMKRPPRPPREPLFSRRLLIWSLLQGLVTLGLLLGFHAALRAAGMPEPDAHAISFVSLVLTNVALIFVNRSFSTSLVDAVRRPNVLLWRGLLLLATLLLAVLYVPYLKHLFGFGTLHWDNLALSTCASILLICGLEISKRWLSPLVQNRMVKTAS